MEYYDTVLLSIPIVLLIGALVLITGGILWTTALGLAGLCCLIVIIHGLFINSPRIDR